MSIVIRKAEDADLNALVEIEEECSGMPWTRAQMEEEISYPLGHTYVAEESGAILGFFSMHIVSDDSHLNEFGVRKEYRRRGVGWELARKMISLCGEHDCSVFSLEVRESAGPARTLYEKMGCSKAGIRRGFYQNPKEDAVVYIMKLKED